MAKWQMNGEGFKAWRKRMKLTQPEAAEKFQVSRVTIQNWESSETPLSIIIQQGCEIWERRIRQTWPELGPVTLVYSDSPMFVDPYKGGMGMIQHKPFKTNAEALQHVREKWGAADFHNPFILIGEPAVELWNVVELERVASGADTEAP